MHSIFGQLKGRLVVSCQASPGDPLDNTDVIRRMAQAAIGGGAAGLRVNSAEHIAAIRRESNLPIIGIEKHYGPAGLRITSTFADAARLAAAGASIIALDCTDRAWPDGEPWQKLIRRIHDELNLLAMADISTIEEALAAEACGADCIGPTLNGYTENTRGNDSFNWKLMASMAKQLKVPIMAEGHISTPAEARRATEEGAWCVIVGSAITRPGTITTRFVHALNHKSSPAPAIGADIGGTAIKAGLVERNGTVRFPFTVPTDASKGREAISTALTSAIEQVLASARTEQIEPAGIGIATAGAVDQKDGSIFAATENLPGWSGFPLRAFAEEHFHLPAFVVNDAQAAALSELRFGGGRGLSDFVAITLGTGIGGGIVSGGALLRGTHGFSGTIGHHVIRQGGRPCNCGRSGCLEAYVSTAALIAEYRANGGMLLKNIGDDAAHVRTISEFACQGDIAAQKAYAALAGYLAEGIANLFNILDPQAVLLSGGLIEGQSDFVSGVQTKVESLLHFGEKRRPLVRTVESGRFTGVRGAGALAFESERRADSGTSANTP